MIVITNITIIVYAEDNEFENDYIDTLYSIKEVTKSVSCQSIIDGYLNCFIDYRIDDSIPDYNKDCDNFTSKICKAMMDNTTSISNCENKYHVKLLGSIENAYYISNLYCYRNENNEFCPLSRIFQKAQTVKEEVTDKEFNKSSIFRDYCIDDLCTQYIGQSYVGIYALHKIGILDKDIVMSSINDINEYVKSADCMRIQRYYGDSETGTESYSGKKYLLSMNTFILTLLTSLIFSYI